MVGENSYLVKREIAKLCETRPVSRDGLELNTEDLPGLLAGQTLFSQAKCLVIESASANKTLWSALESYLSSLDDDTTLILVEVKPDKRTKMYKWLQKHAKVIDCKPLQVNDRQAAESWLSLEAKQRQLTISPQLLADMVERAIRSSQVDDKITVIDQQLLITALDQLSAAEGEVTADMVETILPPSLYENVFDLLSLALNRRPQMVRQICRHLQTTEDGYKVMALLASQAVSAAALLISEGRPPQVVAAELNSHPYAMKQLEKSIHNVEPQAAVLMVAKLADADERLKQGQGDPWQLIEQTLTDVSIS